jgi:hypothetical protein
MFRPDPIITDAAVRAPDRKTSVVPDAFFSPLSYSLSVEESSSRQHHPMRPPPPPSTQKNERSRLLSFSQDYTPRSLLNQSAFVNSTTKKGVQDLLVYIDNMAFSPHKDRAGSKNQGLPSTNRSSKALRDRTNQAPFPEMTPVKSSKTPRNNSISSSQKKKPPLPNTMTTPAATVQRKDDPPTSSNTTSLIGDLANASKDDDPAWTRLEEMAARVRRALDPEPSETKTFEEAESTVLRTAFTELGPQQAVTSRRVSQELNVSSSHSSLAFQTDDLVDESDNIGVRVGSPEDAKKLLRTAVGALHDARAERESARQWASSMKEAVNKWVDEQRKLIRTETTSRLGAMEAHEEQIHTQTASLSKLEQSIQSLYEELTTSNQTRQTTEKKLQRLLLDQQDKIHALGQQLSSIEQTVSEQGTRSSMASRAGHTGRLPSPKDTVIPRYVDKTPKAASGSQASSSSSRVKRRTKDGGHVIAYSNGVQKEVHPDGTTVIRFANGDVETKFAESGTVAYFHKEDRVMQITTTDGSTLFEYPNRQVERHYPDGSKAILYPDGTKQGISPRGHAENKFA